MRDECKHGRYVRGGGNSGGGCRQRLRDFTYFVSPWPSKWKTPDSCPSGVCWSHQLRTWPANQTCFASRLKNYDAFRFRFRPCGACVSSTL